VLIEIPHFASLRGREREIMILRSDDGFSWKEHTVQATDEAIQDALAGTFEGKIFSSIYTPAILYNWSFCKRIADFWDSFDRCYRQ